MIRAHPRHMRAAKVCMKAGRDWFPKQGKPWSEFVEQGVDVDWLRATGDPFALKVVAEAEKEANRG